MHKKIQVVVIDPHGREAQILLLQTGPDRGEFWQPVTGSVEKGEKFKAGAYRELVEETGIEAGAIISLKYKQSFHDRWKREVKEKAYLFITAEHQPKIKLDPREHQAYRWLPVKAINAKNFRYQGNYEAFVRAKKQLEKMS